MDGWIDDCIYKHNGNAFCLINISQNGMDFMILAVVHDDDVYRFSFFKCYGIVVARFSSQKKLFICSCHESERKKEFLHFLALLLWFFFTCRQNSNAVCITTRENMKCAKIFKRKMKSLRTARSIYNVLCVYGEMRT